jgi:Mrp family chromosome partitioning ATPase
MTTTFSDVHERANSAGLEQVLGQLQASGQGLNRARVLGITGCRSGDGATFVLGTLARLLATRSRKRVLQADSVDLFTASCLTPAELLARCWFTDQPGRWILSPTKATSPSRLGESAPEGNLGNAMSVLDSQFDFVVLDCGAVTSSGRLWQLAPLIDDLLLVVAAGETRRDQVLYAQRIIEQSGARLSGCILNKRTYPLPTSIHRVLS